MKGIKKGPLRETHFKIRSNIRKNSGEIKF